MTPKDTLTPADVVPSPKGVRFCPSEKDDRKELRSHHLTNSAASGGSPAKRIGRELSPDAPESEGQVVGKFCSAMTRLASAEETVVNASSGPDDLTELEKMALKGAFGHYDAEVIDAFRRHTIANKQASQETRLAQLELKLLAARLFKKKKAIYPHCFDTPFSDNHLESIQDRAKAMTEFTKSKNPLDGKILYTTLVHKIDRTTYVHKTDDIVIVTNAAVFVLNFPKIKFKYRLPLKDIEFISLSQFYDGIVVLHTAVHGKKDMGDRIYDTPHAIEFVSNLVRAMRLNNEHWGKEGDATTQVYIRPEIQHQVKPKKMGKIVFKLFGDPGLAVIKDGKDKILQVTHPKIQDAQGFKRSLRGSLRKRATGDIMPPGLGQDDRRGSAASLGVAGGGSRRSSTDPGALPASGSEAGEVQWHQMK